MIDHSHLITLLEELRVLAIQAKKRGDMRRENDLPAEYWYGVEYGYEDAAERVKVLIEGANDAAD